MTGEEAHALLGEFVEKLGEHFDHVQILATWNEEGLTKAAYSGCGSWYARQGLAHEFINKDIAQENAHQLAEKINPPPDDYVN